ncbi:hypothetical protein Tco_0445451 [Tanacetum coccineum]
MELILEQTQQGISHEVSVSAEGVKELKRKVNINGEKKEALLTLKAELGQYIYWSETQSPMSGNLKQSSMDPVTQCKPSPTTQGLSIDSCFISHGDYMHFYQLSHFELVGIEKVNDARGYTLFHCDPIWGCYIDPRGFEGNLKMVVKIARIVEELYSFRLFIKCFTSSASFGIRYPNLIDISFYLWHYLINGLRH